MAISVADNFLYQGKKPLDARILFETISAMVNMPGAVLYDGCLGYVKADKKYYTYNSTNTTDASLGKWRELETGGGEGGVVEGYYYNNKFYEESTHTTEITGVQGYLYISVDNEQIYRFNGTNFIALTSKPDTVLYQPAGTVTFANLPALGASVLGFVYDVSDDFTTTADFVEGAGKKYGAHTDVAVVNIGTKANPVYKFNVFVGAVGQYTQKAILPTASADEVGNIYQFVGTTDLSYTNGYFYQCIEDPDNVGSYIWIQKNVQPASSGSGGLTKAITAAVDVGGISKNDSFAKDTAFTDMWDALLNPTLYPTFTAPLASLSYSLDNSGYYKVGATVSAKTATLSYNAGAITLDGVKQNDRGGAATKYTVTTTGAATEYSDSSTSSGSFNVSALTRATKGTITITGTVNYAQGPQPKDSKNGDYDSPLAAGTVTATKTLNFIQPYYYGASNTSTISDFTGLTEAVSSKGNKTYQFTTSNQHMVFAYDSSYGNLKKILDGNGFDVTGGWTKNTVTVGGFSYFVYVANSKTTDTNAPFTFNI